MSTRERKVLRFGVPTAAAALVAVGAGAAIMAAAPAAPTPTITRATTTSTWHSPATARRDAGVLRGVARLPAGLVQAVA
jgi:hypothetical protein